MATKKRNLLSSLDEYSQPEQFELPGTNPLDQPCETATAVFEGPVLNVFPTITSMPYRMAIIGEAPGVDEVHQKEPFVGMSGRFLTGLLSKAGIVRTACFVGNVCQYRPPGNDIENFNRQGEQIQQGLRQLNSDLERYKPNVCLLLGKTALWAFKGLDAIGDWRGSFFLSVNGYKCISSYHPVACLRMYDWTPLLMFDIKKAFGEATTPTLTLPQRDLWVPESQDQIPTILSKLEEIKNQKPTIAIDIEGYVDDLKCISIAPSGQSAFIVPFANFNKGNYYQNIDDEVAIWQLLVNILADPTIPKVLQNSLYDRFVLQYSYGVVVRGTLDDTMLKHWELYCELEKSLGFQCSIYTKEPFYKFQRKAESREDFWRYCCRDSAVTFEINEKLTDWVSAESLRHYRFNVALLNPLLYMELKGIRYDNETAKTRRLEVLREVYSVQYEMDTASGRGLDYTKSRQELEAQLYSVICYKRDITQPKSEFVDIYEQAVSVIRQTDLSNTDKGFLNTICKLHMNTRSSKQFQSFLYKEKGLPIQYKRTKDGQRPTTDFEALLRLKKKSNDVVLDYAISLTMHRTRAQMLSIIPAKDGRIRCSYNIVGSETGRVATSRSMDHIGNKRVGTNMQTVSDDWEVEDEELVLLTEGLRTLYLADEGYNMFQCDLKGSDGWTIGAILKSLGNDTMLEDLKAGLKPAQVVAYILRHGLSSVSGVSRPELKELLKEVKKTDQDYYICKTLIWGVCYLMGPRKMAEQVFKETYGKIQKTEKEMLNLQQAIFSRYQLRLLHEHGQREIARQSYPPKQISAGGQTRKFFGRKEEVLGEWLANLPQQNTTYATNLACLRAWSDPENKVETSKGLRPRFESLHQVHDALIGQSKVEDTEWTCHKLKEWFNNTLIIAGVSIIIPFDGGYGKNWGDLNNPIL